jgi:hypothetical protein
VGSEIGRRCADATPKCRPLYGGSAKSALLRKADLGSAGGHVGFVPQPDIDVRILDLHQ